MNFISLNRVAVLLIVLSFFMCTDAPAQTGEDWPGFLGPRQDGTSTQTGIRTDWSAAKLKDQWTLELGEGYSIGSVADGHYFHFDVEIDLNSNQFARLRCVDLQTGKQKWQHRVRSSYKDLYGYDSGPRSSPLIHDGKVYIFGVDGWLRCIDQQDGSLIWEQNTSERFSVVQNFFGVSSCPIIAGDLLLVMIGGSPKDADPIPKGKLNLVKPDQCAIVAFNRNSGEIVYKTGNDLASYSSLRLARLHDTDVALAWMREKLICFRPADGEILFTFPWRSRILESVNASTPVVDGNQIFLGECYGPGGVLIEITAKPDPEGSTPWNCEIVWSDKSKRDQSLAPHWNTPVLHDGYLYGCSGRHEAQAELKCVRMSDGEVMWSEPSLGRTSVTLCAGQLIVMSERGTLQLAKATPEKFDLVTQYDGDIKFRAPCWAAPVVAQGKLIVRGKNKVVCFSVAKKAAAEKTPE